MSSRLSRYQERIFIARLIISIVGSVGIVIFLVIFGLPILIKFSLLVDQLRGNPKETEQAATIILPPVLDPLPEATNSSYLIISGRGQPGNTLLLYRNDEEVRKLTLAEEGSFSSRLTLAEGENVISAKLTDDAGNMSELSNVVRTIASEKQPTLELASPEPDSTVNGDNNTVVVSGHTDEKVKITVNDRFVVVRSDGSFMYNHPLSEGENHLKIVATSIAGNQTTIERTVRYQK